MTKKRKRKIGAKELDLIGLSLYKTELLNTKIIHYYTNITKQIIKPLPANKIQINSIWVFRTSLALGFLRFCLPHSQVAAVRRCRSRSRISNLSHSLWSQALSFLLNSDSLSLSLSSFWFSIELIQCFFVLFFYLSVWNAPYGLTPKGNSVCQLVSGFNSLRFQNFRFNLLTFKLWDLIYYTSNYRV